MARFDALARRRTALDIKLKSLSGEVATWLTLLDRPPRAANSKPLRDGLDHMRQWFMPHHSQIKLTCAGLDAMRGLIAEQIEAAEKKAALSSTDIAAFERKILAAVQIWESYRSKFVLRNRSITA